MSATIYFDESGDLGFNFSGPPGQGGSSTFLTIAAVCMPSGQAKHVMRFMRDLYDARKWNPKKEKKWADMSDHSRLYFAHKAVELFQKRDGIKYLVATAEKRALSPHVHQMPETLYNYMARSAFAGAFNSYNKALIIPDQRSIKKSMSTNLRAYLQAETWFSDKSPCVISYEPRESHRELGVQFADMLAGVADAHFSHNKSDPWNALMPALVHKTIHA